MSFDSVMDRLAAVAEKYLAIANETSDTKVAQRALGVVEKSLGLAKKINKRRTEVEDPAGQFLSFVHIVVKRSILWQEYLFFCEEFKYNPGTKGEFFARMRRFGFLPIKKAGEVVVIPPAIENRCLLPKSELPYEFSAEASPVAHRNPQLVAKVSKIRSIQDRIASGQ